MLAPSLTHAWFICVRKQQHTLPPSGCRLALPSSAAACQVHPDVFQLRVPIPQLGALQSVRCGFLATNIRELSAVRGKRQWALGAFTVLSCVVNGAGYLSWGEGSLPHHIYPGSASCGLSSSSSGTSQANAPGPASDSVKSSSTCERDERQRSKHEMSGTGTWAELFVSCIIEAHGWKLRGELANAIILKTGQWWVPFSTPNSASHVN